MVARLPLVPSTCRRRRACAPASFLALALAACSPQPQGMGVAGRAIAELPRELFDPGSVFAHTVVRSFDLTRVAALAVENPPIVVVPGPFAAAEVDELNLFIGEMSRGQLIASWEGRDGTEPVAGQIVRQAEHAARQSDGTLRFTFALADAPAWRGQIDRLLVHTGVLRRFAIRPLRADLAVRRGSAAALDRALASPWLTDLEADRRPALLAAPGHPRILNGGDPRATRLSLSLASCPTNRQAVAVRILDGAVGDAEAAVLWRVDLAAGETRWRDIQVPLTPRAAAATLRVEIDGPPGSLVYLADPTFLAPAAERRRNLLLISIDTLRADHLSLYGYSRKTSPELEAWSRDAVVFRRAVTSATTTLPSHTSLFTGIEASRHGVHRAALPATLETLADHLRRAGWRTMARTGGGYLHPFFGLNRGFERFSFHRPGIDRPGELAAGMAVVGPWLEELRDEPFFLFLHTYEVHAPYRPRPEYLAQFSPGPIPEGLAWPVPERDAAATGYRVVAEPRYLLRGEDPNGPELGTASIAQAAAYYDSSIRYVDSVLGGLFAELERLGLAANTVVVVTSDHGEAFGEHGEGGHGYLYDNNAVVPLVIRAPGAPGRTLGEQVRSVDVAPTVLDLLGAPPMPDTDGVSLRPVLAGEASQPLPADAITTAANTGFGLALRTADLLELHLDNGLWPPGRGATALFDLRADPGEERDLHVGHPRTRELTRRLLAGWARVAPGLHLKLSVPAGHAARVELDGPELAPILVRAVDFTGEAAWDGHLRLDLTAGSTTDLILDLPRSGVTAACLGQRATLDGERGTSVVGGVRLDWRWQLVGGWQTATPPADDELLRSQLRALGYVN